ncbi:MAG: DnaA regulatory inactivator Hda [Gammaproteobacteria bacterium]|nr:DnaA regulatory inactivator Hda [Gammaproteobacteria bacterium]
MQQLPLNVRLAEHAVFESFHAGPNEAAIACLREAAAGAGPRFTWLWGPGSSGRSHLLQAAVTAAHALGRPSIFLPMAQRASLDPAMLDGLETASLVAVDDIDAIAGDGAWEPAMLLLYERIVASAGRLVMSSILPPARSGFRLPDLASRLSTAAVYQLVQGGDEQLLRALQKRAAWLGLELPDVTGRFLLTRVERDMAALCRELERLDREALAAQRRLTVPFVSEVLGSAD